MDEVIRKNPGIHLDIYIDDITTNVQGKTDKQVTEVCRKAAKDLKEAIKVDLRCEIAVAKEAVVASSADLATAVSEAIGKLTITEIVWQRTLESTSELE